MLVFGSEMHVLTFVFLIIELMMFAIQCWSYYIWPKDRARLLYLILLLLLIIYNVTGGLFPDEHITLIPVYIQNILAYGSGFIMASYFPFYFYKAYNLSSLRFVAIFGIPIFVLLPYIIFFVIIYSFTRDLGFAIHYGLIIPFLYSLYVLWAILKAIRHYIKINREDGYPLKRTEMLLVYLAVFPWVCLAVFSYFNITQWIEVLFTNIGFIIITILFLQRRGKAERFEKLRLIDRDELIKKQNEDFKQNCRNYNLTKRECEIAELLCRGLTYKEVGATLFIAENTVDAHVQKIFGKTGVNKKIDLRNVLGYVG
ncbi:helix-turn-helix transcriptional regulator [Pedobacter sp. MC2016-15]|uniref:helix-turn-helix transcriptional regulator n=1 Tax=Pedobacter sp. MC2016-15 TaxID=2994473 RepID=UPI0022476DBB|nr:helix-turn-helix transcriptional regulator [Pedobacter sp. MC2016-15]MCX2479341.1 helix-turn-helix transcriptional regulator [Pedobacter sp. MC2016-15]